MRAAAFGQCELIAFADQDDVWFPQKLEKCAAVFEHEDVLLAYHSATFVNENLQPIVTVDSRAAPRAINPPLSLEPRLFGLGFTQVFKQPLVSFNQLWRSSIDYNHPHEPEAHDQWYFFLASCLGSIAYIAEPLALYRRHAHTVSSSWGDIAPSARGKLNVLFSNNIDTIKARESSAASRAAALECAQDRLDGVLLHRAMSGTEGYRKLQKGLRLRREMYESDNLLFRLRQIITVLCQGGYSSHWGSGPQAFIRDALRGLLFPLTLSPRDATP
jgi:hypothetical protein